ncbi:MULTISPECIES: hypothetical protein [Mesorhizobium]|uniref:hypothetical protein n=1 Tax=Mesorhizobium TaxID=68287 RepID=UPI0003CF0A99|nr:MULTISPECIES: hypothetical protein [Mesorhizobium]ESY70033.1 hypothetical protein X742_06920 [Mesorhizobium sp. LNHC232B00]WJI39555.1 hypothetical protein NL534_04630 [Mesorhizobium opportunistum]
MGAIAAIMLTGLAIVGAHKFFTKRDFRQSLLAEFAKSPVETTFVFSWCGCGLLFFWGVFVPALGTIKVPIAGKQYELWAVAGIAFLAGFAIMIIYEWLKTPRYPK